MPSRNIVQLPKVLLYRREYIKATASEYITDVTGDERNVIFDQTASNFAAEVLGSKTTSPNGLNNFITGYSWMRSRLSAEEFQGNKTIKIFFNKEDVKKAIKKYTRMHSRFYWWKIYKKKF